MWFSTQEHPGTSKTPSDSCLSRRYSLSTTLAFDEEGILKKKQSMTASFVLRQTTNWNMLPMKIACSRIPNMKYPYRWRNRPHWRIYGGADTSTWPIMCKAWGTSYTDTAKGRSGYACAEPLQRDTIPLAEVQSRINADLQSGVWACVHCRGWGEPQGYADKVCTAWPSFCCSHLLQIPLSRRLSLLCGSVRATASRWPITSQETFGNTMRQMKRKSINSCTRTPFPSPCALLWIPLEMIGDTSPFDSVVSYIEALDLGDYRQLKRNWSHRWRNLLVLLQGIVSL